MNSTEISDDLNYIKMGGNAVWGFASIIGIPCNLLVVIFIFRDRTVSNIILLNLALADLLFLSGTPLVVMQSVNEDAIFGQTMCQVFVTINGVNQFASSVFMAVLALDRYLAVCHPVKSTSIRTARLALSACLLAWMVVVVEMIPLLTHAQLIDFSESENSVKSRCMLYWNSTDLTFDENFAFSRRFFTSYSFLLTFAVPMGLIFYCYGRIIVQMWVNHGRVMKTISNLKRRTQRKVTLISVAIMLLYTVCWMPFWVLQWAIDCDAEWTFNTKILVPVSVIAYAMQYVKSAVNPLFYILLVYPNREKLNRSRSEQNRRTTVQKLTTPPDTKPLL